MQHEQKPLKDTLAPLLRVLRDLGGKFSFMDDEGNQFVLASKEALEEGAALRQAQDKQLSLPQAQSVARAIRKHVDSSIEDDVLERINRDIALAANAEQDDMDEAEEGDDLAELSEEEISAEDDLGDSYVFPPSSHVPKPPIIRFEPLKGDLHPDLQ